MKNRNIVVAIAILASTFKSYGQQTPPVPQSSKQPLTYMEKEEVAWALQVLVEAGAISADPSQCLQFDGSLIDELKKLGLINTAQSHFYEVCAGSQNTGKGTNNNPGKPK